MRKLSIAILLLTWGGSSFGATYYVDQTGGADANAGTSTGAAWKTISKVNGSTFSAGDSILFAKDNTWRESLVVPSSGSAGSPITFSSYGTGAKPKILGSVAPTSWTDNTGNRWYAVDNVTVDVGNLIFNSEASVGVKKSSAGALGTQGDFFYNTVDHHVYLYSTSNPGTAYTSIEMAKNWNGAGGGLVYINNKNYITIDGFDVRYSGSHGIKTTSAVTGITLQNNSVSFIGGSYLTGTTRYGNGTEVWMNGDISNVSVLNNTISETYDEGITFQIDDAAVSGVDVSNVLVSGNSVNNCGRGISHSMTNVTGTNTQDNVVYEYNSFTNNGRGWAAPGGSNPTNGSGQGALLNSGGVDTMTNCYFRNNTIDNTSTTGSDLNGNGIYVQSGGAESWTITRNTIKNARNQYIRITGGLAGSINYNLLYGAMSLQAIMVYSNTATLSMLNNTIVKTSGDDPYGLIALGAGGAVSNLTFKNNIIYDTANANWTFRKEAGSTVILGNNLYYDTDGTATLAFDGTGYTTKSTWEAASGEIGSVLGNPLFVSTSDFHLQAGSPAINAGGSVGLSSDYTGAALNGVPDLGAFESFYYPLTPSAPRGLSTFPGMR